MLKRLFAIVVAILLISNQVVDTVKAVAFDEQFFSTNQIFYYDARCASETGSGLLTVSGKDNLDIILKFFMQKGLTLAQASGIAGNMAAESGLDPTIIQGGSHAQPGYMPQSGVGFGLVQWTSKGRQDKLVQFIYGDKDGKNKGAGVDITDINGQLNFAWKELSEDYSNTLTKLKATDDPVEAAVIVHDGYESSADSHAQVVANRGGNAYKFWHDHADAPALAGSTSSDTQALAAATKNDKNSKSSKTNTASGACVGNEFSGGDLGDTTKAYAWPEYIPAGGSSNSMPGYEGRVVKATDMTEAYAQAVTRAKADGQYVGGIRLAGIDCGGAVTRILIDSGFEPKYNFSGKKANGAGFTGIQEKWLKQNWDSISATDANDRQPGDVAINDSHTYLYVGEQVFASRIVSASLDERAPMQGHEGVTDSSFRWYRKRVALSGAEL